MTTIAVRDGTTTLAHTQEKGIGVFAVRPLQRGAIILQCPYIVVGPRCRPEHGSDLEHYVFAFPFTRSGKPSARSSLSAVVFGDASMLNHADIANCLWSWDLKLRVHKTIAARDIEAGEELTFCYGWEDHTWNDLGGKKA